jgi:hypothetical protein
MNKYVIFIFLGLILAVGMNAQTNISGINEAQFIYKSASDSLSTYFHNEANLRLNHRNIELGLSLISDFPRYSQFETIQYLSSDDLDFRVDNIYLQISLENINLRAGSFSEFFGAGIVFRSYRDKVYDWDTRLKGLSLNMNTSRLNLKSFFGIVPTESNPDREELAAGIDLSTRLTSNIEVGSSLASFQEARFDNRYRTRIVGAARTEVYFSLFDIYTEYAESKLYRDFGQEVRGQAIYGFANTYLGVFSISSGYKKYSNFDNRLNDLPVLNSTEEPLSERFEPGFDEEGLLGKVSFVPDHTTEIALTYSEAWNSSSKIRQSDFLAEARKDFPSLIIGLEYSQLEMIDKDWQLWEKTITPALLFDFNLLNIPVHIRTQYGIESVTKEDRETTLYNPMLQTDYFFNRFSLSIIAETEYQELSDITDSEFWFGTELTSSLFKHTDVKIFAGKEKGGKVCRSGSCFYTTPFTGLRIDVTTRF